MEYRTLGHSRLKVSKIGFGCMGLSFGYNKTSPVSYADAVALLHKTAEVGVRGCSCEDHRAGRTLSTRAYEAGSEIAPPA